ncbi:dTMP kinase [bacterium]|nr:dTMP kinase [bacterium]
MRSGKLITLEGIDGSGKSTQAEKLLDYLKGKKIKCKLLREPGGTDVGEAVRHVLLAAAGEGLSMNPLTEYLLFAASRAELSRTVIKPLLERGSVVILDRFGDSSTAYQGYGNGVDHDFIIHTNVIATGGLKPDLSLLFDIDPETALARPGDFNDRIEKRGLEFFKRVRKGFLTIAGQEPDRFRVIDASQGIETVWEEVVKYVDGVLCERVSER